MGPPTIEAMIAELGPPRSYAEQVLIDRMRAHAAAEAIVRTVEMRHAEWAQANTTKHAIDVFRLYGNSPVMERKL